MTWTPDDAFKLHQTISTLPYPRVNADEEGTPVTAVWRLTDDMLDGDYMVQTIAGTEVVTVAKDAFTYAEPLVVNFDGDQGQFFSRRLFKALLSHLTDEGTDAWKVAEIAEDRYGIDFMEPSSELEGLMNETQSNFQPFPAWEKLQIMGMLEEFPEGLRKARRPEPHGAADQRAAEPLLPHCAGHRVDRYRDHRVDGKRLQQLLHRLHPPALPPREGAFSLGLHL